MEENVDHLSDCSVSFRFGVCVHWIHALRFLHLLHSLRSLYVSVVHKLLLPRILEEKKDCLDNISNAFFLINF